MVMSLYKDKVREHAIHAAVTKPSLGKHLYFEDFAALKIEYKYVLKELIIEMKKEIRKINKDLKL